MLVYQRVLGISSSQLTSCHIFQRGKGFTTKQKYMINYAIMWQIQCSSSPSHHHFKEFFVHHSQMVGLWHWVSTRWSFHCHVDRGNISSTPPYIKCLCYKHDKRKASVCRWWDISCNVLTHKNITNYKHMYIFFGGQNLLYIYIPIWLGGNGTIQLYQLLTAPYPEATWERGGCWCGETVLGRVQRGASPSEMFVGL